MTSSSNDSIIFSGGLSRTPLKTSRRCDFNAGRSFSSTDMKTLKSLLLSRRKFLKRNSSSIAVIVILKDDDTADMVDSSKTESTESTGDSVGFFVVGFREGETVFVMGAKVSSTTATMPSVGASGDEVGSWVIAAGEIEGTIDGSIGSASRPLWAIWLGWWLSYQQYFDLNLSRCCRVHLHQ